MGWYNEFACVRVYYTADGEYKSYVRVDSVPDPIPDGEAYAILLEPPYVVIDIDTHEANGYVSVQQLLTDAGVDPLTHLAAYPSVETGGGGLHVFCRVDPPYRLMPGHKGRYPGVDVLWPHESRLAVMPGSTHRKTGAKYEWSPGSPVLSEPPYLDDRIVNLIFGSTDDSGEGSGPEQNPLTNDELTALLKGLPVTEYRDYDTWLSVVQGAHHATAGAGGQPILDWCRSDPKYADDTNRIEGVWSRCRRDSGHVNTVGTLIHEYKRHNGGDLPPHLKAREHARQIEVSRALSEVRSIDYDDDWETKILKIGKTQKHTTAEGNLNLTLRNHEVLRGAWAFNEREQAAAWRAPNIRSIDDGEPYPKLIKDYEYCDVVDWLQAAFRVGYGHKAVAERINVICQDPRYSYRYDPFAIYIQECERQSGVHVEDFLSVVCGAEDTELMRAYSRNFFVSIVARALRPGCKVDTMLVLTGDQGLGKSRLFSALLPSPSYFSDYLPDVTKPDAAIQLHGLVILEVAELDTFRWASNSSIKAFISRSTDKFRAPYDRKAKGHPRRSVLVGTTNRSDFLRDKEHRRFWPVTISRKIDIAYAVKNRDALWADAYAEYIKNPVWYLDDRLTEMHNESAKGYEEEMPLKSRTYDFLRKPFDEDTAGYDGLDARAFDHLRNRVYTTTSEVAAGLGLKLDLKTQRELAKTIESLGWSGTRKKIKGEHRRVFRPPSDFSAKEKSGATPKQTSVIGPKELH